MVISASPAIKSLETKYFLARVVIRCRPDNHPTPKIFVIACWNFCRCCRWDYLHNSRHARSSLWRLRACLLHSKRNVINHLCFT
jgi:hypothetical protein